MGQEKTKKKILFLQIKKNIFWGNDVWAEIIEISKGKDERMWMVKETACWKAQWWEKACLVQKIGRRLVWLQQGQQERMYRNEA